MHLCPKCSRHVRGIECRCPFCAASLCYVTGTAPLAITALVGLALFACTGDDLGETTEATTSGSMSASSTGTDSMSSTTGMSTTEMTTTEMTSTSTSTSTTSTSDTTTTTTTTSTSSESDSESTSSTTSTTTTTGDTDTDTGTTQTTTGGDCTGEGEEICGGVCVNTLEDEEHCGKCFNACDDENGNFCDQGECIVILPYGAPMPEPLWA